MKKKDPKYKEYVRRKTQKRERYRKRIAEGKLSHGKSKRTKKIAYLKHSPQIPEFFSLLDNTNETLQYFKQIHESIKVASPRDTIYFDLSSVKTASPDAFMYIIAIIHNDQKLPV